MIFLHREIRRSKKFTKDKLRYTYLSEYQNKTVAKCFPKTSIVRYHLKFMLCKSPLKKTCFRRRKFSVNHLMCAAENLLDFTRVRFCQCRNFNPACASPVSRLFNKNFDHLLKGIFSIVTESILEFSQVVSRG